MFSKKLSWFASEKGKIFVLRGISCLGVGLISLNYVPHAFFLNNYKEFVQMYRNGISVPVPPKTLEQVEQVMDDMKIPILERKLIKPFTVFGFDVFHAGSTHTKSGAILGIPSNFYYESEKDVDRQNVVVSNKSVFWSSKDGQKLLDALVLSTDAKKFAIGREIFAARTAYMYLNTLYPAVVVVVIYGLARNLNNRMQLFSKPLAVRGILYTLLGLFGLGSWAFMKDFTAVQYELGADKEISALGEAYITGGIEFYTKILQRNVSLRELMGDEGKKLYTVTGNEHFLIRQPRLPILYRKILLEITLENLKSHRNEASTVSETAHPSTVGETIRDV